MNDLSLEQTWKSTNTVHDARIKRNKSPIRLSFLFLSLDSEQPLLVASCLAAKHTINPDGQLKHSLRVSLTNQNNSQLVSQ